MILASHLNKGEQIRLYLTEDPSQVAWESMDENVAAVSASGLVTANHKGLAIIKAAFNGNDYFFNVRVVDI